MGQAFLLHIWVSLALPMHSLPPYFGAGSLHRRLRFWIPPPQVRVQLSHGDQGPQLPLTKRDQKKTWVISVLALYNTQMQSDGETYWGTETSDTSRFAGPLPRSLYHQAEGWGSCRGGYGWWHQNHRWRSRMTRVTNGSSCRLAWLKAARKGQRSVIRRQSHLSYYRTQMIAELADVNQAGCEPSLIIHLCLMGESTLC